jgi:hypothetical protein
MRHIIINDEKINLMGGMFPALDNSDSEYPYFEQYLDDGKLGQIHSEDLDFIWINGEEYKIQGASK